MPAQTLSPHPSPEVITRLFAASGGVPNNPKLPLVLLRHALPADRRDLAGEIETLYRANGWGDTWRWSVYDFHHFHTNAHEALAVSCGNARIQFGGEGGAAFDIDVGDVAIIPAGVGHKRLSASEDFQVVGGYPAGQMPDLHKDTAPPSDALDAEITRVPVPAADPIYGAGGPLVRLWRI